MTPSALADSLGLSGRNSTGSILKRHSVVHKAASRLNGGAPSNEQHVAALKKREPTSQNNSDSSSKGNQGATNETEQGYLWDDEEDQGIQQQSRPFYVQAASSGASRSLSGLFQRIVITADTQDHDDNDFDVHIEAQGLTRQIDNDLHVIGADDDEQDTDSDDGDVGRMRTNSNSDLKPVRHNSLAEASKGLRQGRSRRASITEALQQSRVLGPRAFEFTSYDPSAGGDGSAVASNNNNATVATVPNRNGGLVDKLSSGINANLRASFISKQQQQVEAGKSTLTLASTQAPSRSAPVPPPPPPPATSSSEKASVEGSVQVPLSGSSSRVPPQPPPPPLKLAQTQTGRNDGATELKPRSSIQEMFNQQDGEFQERPVVRAPPPPPRPPPTQPLPPPKPNNSLDMKLIDVASDVQGYLLFLLLWISLS